MDSLKNGAYLSNKNGYTIFKYDDLTVRFVAPYSLERYTKVKEWDNGYIVVMAKYKHSEEDEEEYIDLLPIFDKLYLDSETIFKKIKTVEVNYN